MKTRNSIIHKAINVQHSHGHIQCHDNEILLFSSQLIESLDWKNTNYSNTEETVNYIEVASGQILGQDKRLNGRSTPKISDSYGKLSEFSPPQRLDGVGEEGKPKAAYVEHMRMRMHRCVRAPCNELDLQTFDLVT